MWVFEDEVNYWNLDYECDEREKEIYINQLLDNEWDLKHFNRRDYIERHKDDLYVIIKTNERDTVVGVFVKWNTNIYRFEILKKYRGNGYAKCITNQFNHYCVHEVDDMMYEFWEGLENPPYAINDVKWWLPKPNHKMMIAKINREIIHRHNIKRKTNIILNDIHCTCRPGFRRCDPQCELH